MIEKEGPDTVAAFIAEPVMGAGGALMPPEGYFAKVQAVCDRHDVLFIADEVITGFGRLGHMWGSQAFGIRPDTISFAKAVTSAYLPLGGVMVNEAVYQALLDESRKIGLFAHGYTYSGHPVSCAVALKAIEIYERDRLAEQARVKGRLFQRRLDALADHPLVGEARGMGLIGGLEIVADKGSKRAIRGEAGRRREMRRLRASRGADRALALRRPHRALPAADHHRGGDRRALRPSDAGARPHRRMDRERGPDGGLTRRRRLPLRRLGARAGSQAQPAQQPLAVPRGRFGSSDAPPPA